MLPLFRLYSRRMLPVRLVASKMMVWFMASYHSCTTVTCSKRGDTRAGPSTQVQEACLQAAAAEVQIS